jgi:hypothetical protein
MMRRLKKDQYRSLDRTLGRDRPDGKCFLRAFDDFALAAGATAWPRRTPARRYAGQRISAIGDTYVADARKKQNFRASPFGRLAPGKTNRTLHDDEITHLSTP